MSTDPFNSYQNTPTYFLDGETEAGSLKSLNKRIQAHASASSNPPYLKWLSMAAMILVIFFTGQYFSSPNSSALASQYFEAYPNYQSILTRGINHDDPLTGAYQAYDKGEFDVSAVLFSEAVGISSVDKLYNAIALQGLSEWEASFEILNNIRGNIPDEYVTAGEWYTALGLIGLERENEAVPILESIAAGRSIFVKKASDLIQDLE